MDYGGTERRRTKKDLKRKRLVRVYKRGGQQRSVETAPKDSEMDSSSKQKKGKRPGKSKRKRR